jgi:hypothetical protein
VFNRGRSSEQSIEVPQNILYKSIGSSTPNTGQRKSHSRHRQHNPAKGNTNDLYYSADELDEETDEFVIL